jgi:tyrosyl-DNA phosphodiesterase 2
VRVAARRGEGTPESAKHKDMTPPRPVTPLAFSPPNGAWLITPTPAPVAPAALSILTWNAWFGGHKFDQRRVALVEQLATGRPDVIVLQEATPELLHAITHEDWARRGYQVSDATGRTLGDYGVLLLSRVPIARLSFLELPSTMGRALLVAELANGLTVATVHLESMGHSATTRAAQLELIQMAIADSRDLVLAGDMNFTPNDPDENAVLDPTLVDVWPVLHASATDEPGYTIDSTANTMRSQLKSRATHKRIDRIFTRGTTWRPRTIELVGTDSIDGDGTFISDHFGLLVELGV